MNTLAQIWSAGDAVSRAVALLLLAMSVSAWVVILWKAWVLTRVRADLARAVLAFWAWQWQTAPLPGDGAHAAQSHHDDDDDD